MAASTQEPELMVAASSSPQLPHSPADEEERRETMKVLGISGDKFAPDPMLDSMCKTISKLMDVPIAGSPLKPHYKQCQQICGSLRSPIPCH